MKGTRLINRFSEKILIWATGSFWPKNGASSYNSGSALRVFQNFAVWKGLIGK